MSRPLQRADCIVVMGGHDIRVAEWAGHVYLEGWAPWLVLSGGFGYYTRKIWEEPEAERFAKIVEALGVPEERMLLEIQMRRSPGASCSTKWLARCTD